MQSKWHVSAPVTAHCRSPALSCFHGSWSLEKQDFFSPRSRTSSQNTEPNVSLLFQSESGFEWQNAAENTVHCSCNLPEGECCPFPTSFGSLVLREEAECEVSNSTMMENCV